MWNDEKELLEEWLRWSIEDKDLNMDLEETEEWDSFNIVQFMTEMETNFGLKVSLDDLEGMQTVEDILKFINERREEKCF